MSPAAAFRLQLYRRRAREFVAAKCKAASNLAALRPRRDIYIEWYNCKACIDSVGWLI